MLEQESITNEIQDLLKKINLYTRHSMMKCFEKEEITFHQFYILKTIHKTPNINFKLLGEKLNLAKSSISLLINKLVEEGYVDRIEDPSDRRSKLLILTDKGIDQIKTLQEMNRTTFETLIETIQEDDLNNIKNHLQLLFDAIQDKFKNTYGGCKNE